MSDEFCAKEAASWRQESGPPAYCLCSKCKGTATSMSATQMQARIIAWLRKPSEDGVDCSADRELLAQRLERKEHLK